MWQLIDRDYKSYWKEIGERDKKKLEEARMKLKQL